MSPNDYEGSVEMNMGYCDAFRLWLRCAFDDDILLREILRQKGIPNAWKAWINEQASF